MSLELKDAAVSDNAVICDIFFDAFRDHTVTRRVFPPELKQVREYWTQTIDDGLRDPNAHFVLVADAASSPPGKVVAFAKWIEPRTAASPPPPPQRPWPEGVDTAFADEFFAALASKHEEIMGTRPFWFLEILGVREEYQRRGVGGLLLRWGLERADRDQVEAFVDSSAAGARLYTSHGYEMVDSVMVGGYLERFMLRQPKKIEV